MGKNFDIIEPGATLGVLGSGQLGRMFALEARRMGYRVHTYSDTSDTPTGHLADREWVESYDDLDKVAEFARGVDVVTIEFENVPSATAEAAAAEAPVRPEGGVLHTTQHRLREKAFLSEHGFPLPDYRAVTSEAELTDALEAIGCPAVLKSAGWGYDGKGQARIDAMADAVDAWARVGSDETVLEQLIDFEHEASVVVARGGDGDIAHYGLLENIHVNHILDITISPGRFPDELAATAAELATEIVNALDYTGVLCVELFITKKGELLVNELAPRPHNSGHVTLDQCETSQFEQQVRAICGLPLGSTRALCPAVMVNLLGDLWEGGAPRWERVCAVPGVKLHLYGKRDARPGRKMGHLTALADDGTAALAHARQARAALME